MASYEAEPTGLQSVVQDEYDYERAYGSKGTAAASAAAIESVSPNKALADVQGRMPEVHNEYADGRKTYPQGPAWGAAWVVQAIVERPDSHRVGTPDNVAAAWDEVTEAFDAAMAAKAKASAAWLAPKAAPHSDAKAAGMAGADLTAPEAAPVGPSRERLVEHANGLYARAKTARMAYDRTVSAALASGWASSVADALPSVHAETLAALASLTDAVKLLDSTASAAAQAGKAQNEEILSSQSAAQRELTPALKSMSAAIHALDPELGMTEKPLPTYTRQERERMLGSRSEREHVRLFLLERSEGWKRTNFSRGFNPDPLLVEEMES